MPLQGDKVFEGDHSIDKSVVMGPLRTFADPQFIGVEEVGDTSDDVQAQYGLTQNSPYATVRFEVEIKPGLRQANQISQSLGKHCQRREKLFSMLVWMLPSLHPPINEPLYLVSFCWL